ncbi:MAG: hypothetical protein M1828_001975 [Chrysothrix sp. TS-e1954]|nr:MAG: hypothetical protein M1828_001975 [Chrysothrix sp. TS-e1954]
MAKSICDLPQEILDLVADKLCSLDLHQIRQSSKKMCELFEVAFYSNCELPSAKARRSFLDKITKLPLHDENMDSSFSVAPPQSIPDVTGSSLEGDSGKQIRLLRLRDHIKRINLSFGVGEVGYAKECGPYEQAPLEGPDICQVVQLIAGHVPKATIVLELLEDSYRRFADPVHNQHTHIFPHVSEIHLDTALGPGVSFFANPSAANACFPKPSLCFETCAHPTVLFRKPGAIPQFLDGQRYPDLNLITVSMNYVYKSLYTIHFYPWGGPVKFPQDGYAQLSLSDAPENAQHSRVVNAITVYKGSVQIPANPLGDGFWGESLTEDVQSLKVHDCDLYGERLKELCQSFELVLHKKLKCFTWVETCTPVRAWRIRKEGPKRAQRCDCCLLGKHCARFQKLDLVIPRFCPRLIEYLVRYQEGLEPTSDSCEPKTPKVRRLVCWESLCGLIKNQKGESIWSDMAWTAMRAAVKAVASSSKNHGTIWFLGDISRSECYRFCGVDEERVNIKHIVSDIIGNDHEDFTGNDPEEYQ